jgi:hypothetical protein
MMAPGGGTTSILTGKHAIAPGGGTKLKFMITSILTGKHAEVEVEVSYSEELGVSWGTHTRLPSKGTLRFKRRGR